jgi:segregation and condensation protein A
MITSTQSHDAVSSADTSNTIAVVHGEPILELPRDLYIPPDALTIFLDTFEGPFDLLLYLIRRQNLDILDIPITDVTRQYMHYIELMQQAQLELAADYLVMAALLCEIKSRLLLPQAAPDDVPDEGDPRAELVQQLLQYEQFQQAAVALDAIPRLDRDFFMVSVALPQRKQMRPMVQITTDDLIAALEDLEQRAELFHVHQITKEALSLSERIVFVLDYVQQTAEPVPLQALLQRSEGRAGVVITVLALLELTKMAAVQITQEHDFAPCYVYHP